VFAGSATKLQLTDSLSGSGKFVGRVSEDGKEYVEFELSVTGESTKQQGGGNAAGSMQAAISMRFPEDYSTGYVQAKLNMSVQSTASQAGRQVTVNANVSWRENVRYLNSANAPKGKTDKAK
jgi:hypothetical protein